GDKCYVPAAVWKACSVSNLHGRKVQHSLGNVHLSAEEVGEQLFPDLDVVPGPAKLSETLGAKGHPPRRYGAVVLPTAQKIREVGQVVGVLGTEFVGRRPEGVPGEGLDVGEVA